MTRDDIIKLMQQACDPDKKPAFHNGFWTITQEELERFATLVAEAERKECAQVCDDEATRAGWNRDNDISINQTFWTGGEKLAFSCAEAIRARGTT